MKPIEILDMCSHTWVLPLEYKELGKFGCHLLPKNHQFITDSYCTLDDKSTCPLCNTLQSEVK